MRAYLFLPLIVVVAYFANANAIVLNASDNLTQIKGGRILRMEATSRDPVDEERGYVGEIVKKFHASTKDWLKEKKISAMIKLEVMYVDDERTAQKFLRKNIDPDTVKKALGLEKPNNLYHKNNGDPTPEINFYVKYKRLWSELKKQ